MNRTVVTVIRAGIALSALLMISRSASAFVIDPFNEYQITVVSAIGHVANESPTFPASSGSVLGNYRDIDVYMDRTKGAGDITAETTTEIGGNGILGYSEVSGINGGGMYVTWDGQDAAGYNQVATAGLGTVDFTLNGANKIDVGMYASTPGGTLSLSLWSAGVRYDQTISGVGFGPLLLSFNYSGFKNGGTSITGAQLQNIGAVQLSWITNPGIYGTTANFDFIETGSDVPEPGTMALMAVLIGLGGLGIIRRRLTATK